MSLLERIVMFLAAVGFAAGCNAYDPALGEVPFRCGADEPRCPQGYRCVVRSEVEQLCVQDGHEAGAVDAAPVDVEPDANTFACNSDRSLEVNDSAKTATVIPIPRQGMTYRLRDLAICPTTDVDIFRIDNDQPGWTVRVEVEHDPSRGPLLLEITEAAVESDLAVPGLALPGQPNLIRAEITGASIATYYAQVKATPGVKNNYTIHFALIDPAAAR